MSDRAPGLVDHACQATLDHLGAMVRVWTPRAGVTYVNLRWREATGSSVEANAGEGWLQFVHADDRARLATPAERGTQRYRLLTPGGAAIIVLESSTAWTDETGAVLGVVHTVTPQPEGGTTTMSKWAHELRGPLNAILGWSDLLSAGDAGPDVIERGLKAIATNARQQAQIIKRMTE